MIYLSDGRLKEILQDIEDGSKGLETEDLVSIVTELIKKRKASRDLLAGFSAQVSEAQPQRDLG